MHSTEHDTTRDGDTIHTTISESDAKALRPHSYRPTITVTLGDVDLPAFVSNGQLYVQAPLPLVFKAFVEDLPAFIRDMEIRISDSRGTPFPLDSDGRPVSRPPVVKSRVVRSGRIS